MAYGNYNLCCVALFYNLIPFPGAAMTLATIGVGYTLAMMGSALAIKKPHPTYKVTGGSAVAAPSQSLQNVHTDNMFRLPQFYALGTVLVVVASGVFTVGW